MVSQQVVLAVIVLGLVGGLYWLRQLAAGSGEQRRAGGVPVEGNHDNVRLKQLLDAFDRTDLNRAARLLPDSDEVERARNAHAEVDELINGSAAGLDGVTDGGHTEPVRRLKNGANGPEVAEELQSEVRTALIDRLDDADDRLQPADRVPTGPGARAGYRLPEELARLDLSDVESPRLHRESLDADGTVHYADVGSVAQSLRNEGLDLDELLDVVEAVRDERRRVERTVAAGERRFVREYERIERRNGMVREDFDELAAPVGSWLDAVYFPGPGSRADVDVRAAIGHGDRATLDEAVRALRNCDFDRAVDSLESKRFVATAVELCRLVRDAERGVDGGRYDLSAGIGRGDRNPYLGRDLLDALRSKVGTAHGRSFELRDAVDGGPVEFVPYDGGESTSRMSPRERQRVADAIQMLEVAREGDERRVGYAVDRLPDYDGTVARNLDEFLDVADAVADHTTRFSAAGELADDAGGNRIEVEFADAGGAVDARPAKALREEFESRHGSQRQRRGRS